MFLIFRHYVTSATLKNSTVARPIKNNCDYFPHDRDMRNHKKVKAIRNKFPNGYAIWVMTLEHLTGSDGNVFPHTDLEFELMAGDFGFSVTEIRDVVNYCISLELLFLRDGFVNSDSLDERLAPVFEKRNKAKELSKQQLRKNGKFDSSNADESEVSVAETPQSKVNESKQEEKKEDQSKIELWPTFNDFWDAYDKKQDRDKCEKKWKKIDQGAREKIMEHLKLYVLSTPDKTYRKNPSTYLNNNSWENEVIFKTNNNGKSTTEDRTKDLINGFAQRASQVLNK